MIKLQFQICAQWHGKYFIDTIQIQSSFIIQFISSCFTVCFFLPCSTTWKFALYDEFLSEWPNKLSTNSVEQFTMNQCAFILSHTKRVIQFLHYGLFALDRSIGCQLGLTSRAGAQWCIQVFCFIRKLLLLLLLAGSKINMSNQQRHYFVCVLFPHTKLFDIIPACALCSICICNMYPTMLTSNSAVSSIWTNWSTVLVS